MAEDAAATALTVLALARADDFDGIQELFAAGLRNMVSADALRAAWVAELAQLGSITGVGDPLTQLAGNGTVVKLPVRFERGERTIVVVVGGDGKLAGLQAMPAEAAAPVAPWKPPSYADPEAFSEHDVLNGTGTLSVPDGAGPWPAVVMLPGSGPNDRDGTLGPNKPLKDIAWGLAGQGIAVLRFDKVTYGRRAERARHPEFTMIDEYVPDAIAAIQLLRDAHEPTSGEPAPGERHPGLQAPGLQAPGLPAPGLQAPGLQAPGRQQPGEQHPGQHVPGQLHPGEHERGQQPPGQQPPGQQQPGQQQPGQQQPSLQHRGQQLGDHHADGHPVPGHRARFGAVFVLGHSLGGTVAPRVAAAEPGVAGVILLAGGAEPMHHAALRQLRHIAGDNPAMQAAVEGLAKQVARVDSADLSPGTPAGELPFGVPAPYWLDVRDYDPAALAATLGRPMLILQGGRDYQVTVTDDLARWQAALAGRPDVTVHVYDADDHAFFPGSGPSTPADYERVQHVDPRVVTDIASWIGQVAGQEPHG